MAQDKNKTERCDGACNKHIGHTKQVHVTRASHDWGTFNYCENAIAEDIKRGFAVEIVNEEELGM
jgi:hypothetical protein